MATNLDRKIEHLQNIVDARLALSNRTQHDPQAIAGQTATARNNASHPKSSPPQNDRPSSESRG